MAGPRFLVLGDMGEVGAHGEAYHAEVGQYARDRGVDRLLALGEMTRTSVASFGNGGEHFTGVESLIERLNTLPAAPATILVKGSRFMRMERVVAQLRIGAPACS